MSHPNGRGWSEDFGTQKGISSRDKTHCVNKHEFTEANTRWKKRTNAKPGWPATYQRVCRKCVIETTKRYRERQRIAQANALIMSIATELQENGNAT